MNSTPRRWLKTGAIGLAGLAAGGILASAVTATAEDSTSGASASQSDRGPLGDEQALTGATAHKVREAALATYPGATVDRVETDSEGVYEAHLVTSDGTPVTVQVDKSFTVTGTQTGMGPGGMGGHHGPDGDADGSSGDTGGA